MKFKKVESYFDLYIRDDGFLLKFNQPDKYLDDLLMFKGFTPNNIEKSKNITLQFNKGSLNSIGYTINGWLHWGDGSTTLASESSWIYRDTIVNIIKKSINWVSDLPRYNDYNSLDHLIDQAALMSRLHKKHKGKPHVFDLRTKVN